MAIRVEDINLVLTNVIGNKDKNGDFENAIESSNVMKRMVLALKQAMIDIAENGQAPQRMRKKKELENSIAQSYYDIKDALILSLDAKYYDDLKTNANAFSAGVVKQIQLRINEIRDAANNFADNTIIPAGSDEGVSPSARVVPIELTWAQSRIFSYQVGIYNDGGRL